jgi:hypothetical protein
MGALVVHRLNRSDGGPNNYVGQEQQDSQDSLLMTLVEMSEPECRVKSGRVQNFTAPRELKALRGPIHHSFKKKYGRANA